MKNFKKLFAVMLITIMSATMLIACGGPKVPPEESAKIFLDVLLKDDKTNMAKINMKEEEYNAIKKNKEESFMKGVTSSGADTSSLSDDVKKALENNIYTGLSKVEYEVTPVSTDKDTAKVNVKINCFKLKNIMTNAQNKLKEKLTANPTMDMKEIMKQSYQIVGEEFAAGPSKDDTTTVQIGLIKKENVWTPDENFEKDISKVLMAMQ